MRQHFKISRASEYFDPSELSKRTGRSQDSWTFALFKELMDNALDITDSVEDPKIEINVTDSLLSVWDNGAGMPLELVKDILDFDGRVSDKFAYQGPTRGAQGNAFKTFLGIAFNWGGYAQIESQGLEHTIHCSANPAGQIDVDHKIKDAPCSGTKITIHSAEEVETNLWPWVYNFHLCNPFVQISYLSTFEQDELSCTIENPKPIILYKSGNLQKLKPTDPTSIHWYDEDKFQALAYLQAAKTNIPLGQFIGSFHGLKTSKKRKDIADGLPDLLTIAKDQGLCQTLLKRMKSSAKEIKPTALGLIGRKTLEEILEPERSWYKKVCGVRDDKPWAFEIMVSECKICGLLTAVNHSITFTEFFSEWLEDDWLDAMGIEGSIKQAGADNASVFAHYIGISPEFVSLGKDRINLPMEIKSSIARETRLALTPLYKESEKRNRAKKKADREVNKRAQVGGRSEKQVSIQSAIMMVLPDAIQRATDNESIPANKRGLYYATREMVQEYTDAEIKYNYFAEILTEYWHEAGGRHPLIYYDPRGILYEPHSNKEVPLGTKDVLDYSLPEYQYNKILYIEKKGIWPAIESAHISQKFDMAVIAAEGFATEAARALMQRANDQNYTIFVFHDADPAGYEIARTISEATKTMPNNNISIVDLGLDIETCLDMGLATETFTRKKQLPSGQNFTDLEYEYFSGNPSRSKSGKISCWTDCRRIEINAMGSRDMVNYLDRKIERYLRGDHKVIPQKEVQHSYAEKIYQQSLGEMAQDHFEEFIEEIKRQLLQKNPFPDDYHINTEGYLKENIYRTWKNAVSDSIGYHIAKSRSEIKAQIIDLVNGRGGGYAI